MKMMNRKDRRLMDKTVEKSIYRIKNELRFLNAAGNPKYRLTVQSDFRYKYDRFMDRWAPWR